MARQRTYVDELNESGILPKDWYFEDSDALECPHGHIIELDGECPDGCESPLLTM